MTDDLYDVYVSTACRTDRCEECQREDCGCGCHNIGDEEQ
jgi:hypothetical protein